ncbi:MAG: protein phosphatase 2C domain-containing protein [Chitinophagaceae bacterium]
MKTYNQADSTAVEPSSTLTSEAPINNYLVVAVSVLSAMVIGLLIRNLRLTRGQQGSAMDDSIDRTGVEISKETANEGPANGPLSENNASNASTDDPDAITLAASAEIIALKKTVPFLVSEIMMTAGPRKKFMGEENADKDLGEDVCGFISSADKVLLWLLDGTSDLHCLKNPENRREYFSSRLLAVSIAENLRKTYSESTILLGADTVASAIREVKAEWLEAIGKLPAVEKEILKANIAKKNFPECAATILVVELSVDGAFAAYRSGDSNTFLFRTGKEHELDFVESSLMEKNDESNDRIFFRLRIDESDQFDIIFNEPLHEIVRKQNINTVICFSDGIGKDTENLLKEEYSLAPAKARREIAYQSQETGDDKSICIIEIRERTVSQDNANPLVENHEQK